MTSQDPTRRQDVVGLVDFASQVLHTGDTLVNASTVIAGSDPGEKAFGADAPGGFGELCRQLHRRWTSALDGRAREAKQQGEVLVEVAQRLGKVAADYTNTDVALASRLGDGSESPLPGSARPEPRSITVRPGETP